MFCLRKDNVLNEVKLIKLVVFKAVKRPTGALRGAHLTLGSRKISKLLSVPIFLKFSLSFLRVNEVFGF